METRVLTTYDLTVVQLTEYLDIITTQNNVNLLNTYNKHKHKSASRQNKQPKQTTNTK